MELELEIRMELELKLKLELKSEYGMEFGWGAQVVRRKVASSLRSLRAVNGQITCTFGAEWTLAWLDRDYRYG